MKLRRLLIALVCFFATNTAIAQTETYDNTHLFQTFFEDATTNTSTYLQPFLTFSDYQYGNAFQLGGQVMFPIDRFQLGGELSIINIDPKYGNGETGISDLKFVGRYNLEINSPTKVAVGGYVTLPIGNAKVGQDNLNLGFFGAVRHPLANRLALTGTAMLEFIETTNGKGENSRETGLVLAGGLIYQASSTVNLVGELDLKTQGERSMFSAGADYNMGGGRLRGGLGLGLGNGAPDVMVMAGYLVSF